MSQSPDHIAPPAPTTATGSPIPNIESLLLGAFMENIPDHIYFKDLQSRFVAVSKAKADRDGKPREAFIGKTDFDFFAEEHARIAYADEQVIIASGQPILNKLEKAIRPDGSVTWYVASKLPWRDQAGKIIGTSA